MTAIQNDQVIRKYGVFFFFTKSSVFSYLKVNPLTKIWIDCMAKISIEAINKSRIVYKIKIQYEFLFNHIKFY